MVKLLLALHEALHANLEIHRKLLVLLGLSREKIAGKEKEMNGLRTVSDSKKASGGNSRFAQCMPAPMSVRGPKSRIGHTQYVMPRYE